MMRTAKWLQGHFAKLESFTFILLESNTFFTICQEKGFPTAVFLPVILKYGNSSDIFSHVHNKHRSKELLLFPGNAYWCIVSAFQWGFDAFAGGIFDGFVHTV